MESVPYEEYAEASDESRWLYFAIPFVLGMIAIIVIYILIKVKFNYL